MENLENSRDCYRERGLTLTINIFHTILFGYLRYELPALISFFLEKLTVNHRQELTCFVYRNRKFVVFMSFISLWIYIKQ
jgi:hypothetical protein